MKTLERTKALVSWSGGKDSCFAWYQAVLQGIDAQVLLNFVSREHNRCCFHGIPAEMLRLQAGCVGIPLLQYPVSQDMHAYEEEFIRAVAGIRNDLPRIRAMVFGDIYLDEHKEWVDRVCSRIGIVPVEPLWQQDPLAIARAFIDTGFTAVVVSAKADLFDEDTVGRVFDASFVEELIKKRICPCGENGEFHTLVVDGPVFKKRIAIKRKQPVLKKGFWDHWFLDIQQWQEETKEGTCGR